MIRLNLLLARSFANKSIIVIHNILMNTTLNNNIYNYFSSITTEFDDYYKNKSDFIERFNIWKDILDKYICIKKNVLDIGCGSGVFSFYLAQKGINVTGVDAAENMIKLCEEKKSNFLLNNIEFHHSTLPLLQGVPLTKYDVIICSSVLEYVDGIEDVFSLFKDILKPKGIIIFSLPNSDSIYRFIEKLTFKVINKPTYFKFVKNITTPDKMMLHLHKYNFKLIDIKYFGHQKFIDKICQIIRLPERYNATLFISLIQDSNGYRENYGGST